jgi:hypothetical protein
MVLLLLLLLLSYSIQAVHQVSLPCNFEFAIVAAVTVVPATATGTRTDLIAIRGIVHRLIALTWLWSIMGAAW